MEKKAESTIPAAPRRTTTKRLKEVKLKLLAKKKTTWCRCPRQQHNNQQKERKAGVGI